LLLLLYFPNKVKMFVFPLKALELHNPIQLTKKQAMKSVKSVRKPEQLKRGNGFDFVIITSRMD